MIAVAAVENTMKETLIFAKTEEGKKEVIQRTHKLGNQQRMLLIMVDGKKSVGDMTKQLAAFGDISTSLETLIAAGLIIVSGEANTRPGVPTGLTVVSTLAKVGSISPGVKDSQLEPPAQASVAETAAQTAEGFDVEVNKQRVKALLESNFGPMAGPMVSRMKTCQNQNQFIDYLADCRRLISEALNKQKADRFWEEVMAFMSK